MGSALKIFCLHGSLGHFSDWDFAKNTLIENNFEVVAVDLYKNSEKSFQDWAQDFNNEISEQKNEAVILAYSLGARLALHALLNESSPYIKKAILVSAHPGLEDADLKIKRLKDDALWKEKLFQLKWEEFWKLWNEQEIFKNSSPALKRVSPSASAQEMSSVFDQWSLGNQKISPKDLQKLRVKTLWLYGENDHKFKEIVLRAAKQSPLICSQPIVSAGHRAPWENPEDFMQKILSFLVSKS